MNSYHPKKHRSDGGFRRESIQMLFGTLFVAAVALGCLASFLGQWVNVYVPFLMALILALILALIGRLIGRWTHLRNGFLAGLAGLFAGTVSILSMHSVDAVRFLIHERVMQSNPRSDDISRDEHLSKHRAESVGNDGLVFGQHRWWIYRGLEMVLVAGSIFFVLIGGTLKPYCSTCQKWKAYRELGTLQEKDGRALKCLANGDLPGLLRHQSSPLGGDRLLSIAECPVGGAKCPITVKLEAIGYTTKKEIERKELLEMTYPGAAVADLESLFVPYNTRFASAKPSKWPNEGH